MKPQVIVTGSLAFDHIMSMPGKFSDHILPDKLHILNVSFIMKTFRQEFGGTGGNISYTLGLLDTPNVLVGVAGYDFGDYKKHLSENPLIDISGIRIEKNKNTARGFVITDKDDNQIWGFYEGAMGIVKKVNLKKYAHKDSLLVVAPNDPRAMLGFVDEAIKLKIPYLFDPAFNIAHFTTLKLLKAVKNATILIGNDYEIHLIKKRLGVTDGQLCAYVPIVITTLGSKGSRIQYKGKTTRIDAAKPNNDSDPTGAGDAYRAGFLAGYVRNLPLEICGRMGSVASVYTVEKYGTQTHDFDPEKFARRYKKNFKDGVNLISYFDK